MFKDDAAKTIEGQITKNVLDSMHKMEYEDRRGVIPSREGRHRPHTRWGGYNRAGHDKEVKEEIVRGLDRNYMNFWNPPEKKAKDGSRGVSRASSRPKGSRGHSRGESRGGNKQTLGVTFSDFPDVAANLSAKTTLGKVSSDWPYNRGRTPPRVDPEASYAPVDGRDENGAPMQPDGRVRGRTYVAAHSHAIETAGGFLNGLPRSGANYRPARVCGKGVMEASQATKEAAEFEKLAKTLTPGIAAQMMKQKAKKEKAAIDLDNVRRQIAKGVLDLSTSGRGGHGNGQQIELIPDVICRAMELRSMNLSGNKITRLPESLANMRSLTTLIIDGNGLLELPQSFGGMVSLRLLSLRNNHISKIPMSFARLTHLTDLDLSTNKFSIMPEEVASISSLTTLSFATNVLATEKLAFAGAADDQRKQAPTLSALCNLHTLNLESNLLTVVPVGVDKLTRLRCLRLAHNRIVSTGTADTMSPALDAEFELAKLSSLAECITTIDLSNNAVSSFPMELCSLTQLSSLDLRVNAVHCLPEALSQMVALSNLYLDRNPIHGLPHCINSMWWLTTLSMIHLPIGPTTGLLGGGGAGTASRWSRGHVQPDPRVMNRLKRYKAPPRKAGKGAKKEGEQGEDPTDGASSRAGSEAASGAGSAAAEPAHAQAGGSGEKAGEALLGSAASLLGSGRLAPRRSDSSGARAGSASVDALSLQLRGQDACPPLSPAPSSGGGGPSSGGGGPSLRRADSRGRRGMSLDSAQAAADMDLEIPLGHRGPKCKMAERMATAAMEGDEGSYKWWRWAATTPYVDPARLSGAI